MSFSVTLIYSNPQTLSVGSEQMFF